MPVRTHKIETIIKMPIKTLGFKRIPKRTEFFEIKHIKPVKKYYITKNARVFVQSGDSLVEIKKYRSELKEKYWGYRLQVNINGTTKLKFFYIHYLLAEVFKGVRNKNYYQVMMRDGNYNNLCDTNVRWERRKTPKVDIRNIFCSDEEYRRYETHIKGLKLQQKADLIDKISDEYMKVRHKWKNEEVRIEFWNRILN